MRLGPLPVARLGSVRISLDPALLFGAAYLGWWFFERYQALARLGLSARWPAGHWALALSLAAVHELGHVVGARVGGGRVEALTVSLLGGRMTVSGGRAAELAAAAGGPIASLLFGIAVLAVHESVAATPPDVPLALLDLARLHLL